MANILVLWLVYHTYSISLFLNLVKPHIWFHIDACHGGSLLFSEEHKLQVDGINLGDSITIDPHKGVFTTYSSSYVLFKETNVLADYCRYPEKAYQDGLLDLGLVTPFFGSRKFESLKLWLLFYHMGVEKIGQAVDSRHRIYLRFVEVLEQTDLFVFFSDKSFYRSVFVYYPKNIRDLLNDREINDEVSAEMRKLIDNYTTMLCTRLYQSGDVIFDLFSLDDYSNCVGLGKKKYEVMGMSVGHAVVDDRIYDEVSKAITIHSDELKQKYKQDMLELLNSNGTICVSAATFPNNSPASWV